MPVRIHLNDSIPVQRRSGVYTKQLGWMRVGDTEYSLATRPSRDDIDVDWQRQRLLDSNSIITTLVSAAAAFILCVAVNESCFAMGKFFAVKVRAARVAKPHRTGNMIAGSMWHANRRPETAWCPASLSFARSLMITLCFDFSDASTALPRLTCSRAAAYNGDSDDASLLSTRAWDPSCAQKRGG